MPPPPHSFPSFNPHCRMLPLAAAPLRPPPPTTESLLRHPRLATCISRLLVCRGLAGLSAITRSGKRAR